MKYREIKQKLEAKGFQFDAYQTDYELPMLHYAHPTIKSLNWQITLQFSHDTVLPEDVMNGREYSFDEDWVLDADISAVTSSIDISISYMTPGTLDIDGSGDENIIYLYGEDLKLFDKVLDLICDPYASLNFAKEYSQKVVEFMDWVKSFIPQFQKLKLPHYTYKNSGNEDTLYASVGIKFESSTYGGIFFIMDVLTWKMHGQIKVAPEFCDQTYFDSNTTPEEFRRELGLQWQEHLWCLEKFKNVKFLPLSGDTVIMKDGSRAKFNEL